MMLSTLDDRRLLITLQIDDGRVAGAAVAHWGSVDFATQDPDVGVSASWDREIEPFVTPSATMSARICS